MNRGIWGLVLKKEKWMNCFQRFTYVLVKTQFIRKVHLFLIPQRIRLQSEWHQGGWPTHPTTLSICFFRSGRKSSTKMEIKRFLCSRFRAVCLWNILVDPSNRDFRMILFLSRYMVSFSWGEKDFFFFFPSASLRPKVSALRWTALDKNYCHHSRGKKGTFKSRSGSEYSCLLTIEVL